MKRIKRIFIGLIFTFSIISAPIMSIDVQAAEYEIVFKSGLHGSINGENSVSYKVSGGDAFPNEPVVSVQDGYVFSGWNKQLPTVGATVDGKQVYVAQYDVLVSGIHYIVRYVDGNNVDIATPKATVAEEGNVIEERAKLIPGYTYEQSQLSFTPSTQNETLTFVYALTNPEEVIRIEYEQIDRVEEGTNNDQGNIGGNPQDDPTLDDNAANEDVVEDEEIGEDKTPLADLNQDSNMGLLTIAGVCALLVCGLVLLYLKRKKEQQ